MPKGAKYAIIGTIIAIVAIICQPVVIVRAGQRGVVLNWGAVSENVLEEGIHLKIPFMQNIIKMEIRTQKIETSALSYSNDIQTVDTMIALNYHINPNTVNKLYQEVSKDYESRIIQPAIQEAVKATTAKFIAQELVDQRPVVKDSIKMMLTERLDRWNMTVDEFSIVNFDFSDQYEQAIEDKQAAQQRALEAKNDLDRIKTEAEQKIAQATAEAEAIRIQATAVNAQGGKDYVELKKIEKWDGKLPTQMVPNATVPFINLSN